MNVVGYIVVNIFETFLRILPFPCKPGLIRIGNPDRNSFVFMTCNYHLTVERVMRALRGANAYLLVANSRGINVWCASTGGLLTNHDVVSILKTSGIEELVDHRNVILPQLAATGVEAKVIRKKTGWKVIWGPVYAKDIPVFIKDKLRKTPTMREVAFPWNQRIEMAAAWAFPISVISALLMIPLWPEGVVPVILMTWGLSLLIFLSFPFYSPWLGSEGERTGIVFFDFGRGGFQLILLAALLVGLVGHSILVGTLSWGYVLRWGFIGAIIILIVSIDLMGSTPTFKSRLHQDRLLSVFLDGRKCKGTGLCEDICPRNCYDMDRSRHMTTMPRPERCVQCGACIVQCPFDALCFTGAKGEGIPPDTVRQFKLNLSGKRVFKKKTEERR